MTNNNFNSMRNNPQNIFELQRFLNYISRFYSDIPKVSPDGIYGAETENAVRSFQKRHGMPVTGETDFDTWTEIVSVHGDLQRKNGMPKSVHIFPLDIVSMKEGDSFDEIYILQVMLRRIGRIYQNLTAIEITGVYDADTVRAVNEIRAHSGLEKNGETDREFWNVIADIYSAFTFND